MRAFPSALYCFTSGVAGDVGVEYSLSSEIVSFSYTLEQRVSAKKLFARKVTRFWPKYQIAAVSHARTADRIVTESRQNRCRTKGTESKRRVFYWRETEWTWC